MHRRRGIPLTVENAIPDQTRPETEIGRGSEREVTLNERIERDRERGIER